MTYEQAMSALKGAASEQTRKTLTRHGIDPSVAFGVKYADLYRIAKQAGCDQVLAQRLWESGNHDARILATLVDDPTAVTGRTLDAWVKSAGNLAQADAVGTLTVRTPHAPSRAAAWARSSREWVAAAGWGVVGGLAMAGAGSYGRAAKQATPAPLDEATLADYLQEIERDIHQSKNRVRHAMNNALICIGLHGGRLRDAAVAAAKRIGKVEVDHGDTCCVTPDAVAYIQKVEARNATRVPPVKARPPAAGARGKRVARS